MVSLKLEVWEERRVKGRSCLDHSVALAISERSPQVDKPKDRPHDGQEPRSYSSITDHSTSWVVEETFAPRAAAERDASPLVRELTANLETVGVSYCRWKGNAFLDRAAVHETLRARLRGGRGRRNDREGAIGGRGRPREEVDRPGRAELRGCGTVRRANWLPKHHRRDDLGSSERLDTDEGGVVPEPLPSRLERNSAEIHLMQAFVRKPCK